MKSAMTISLALGAVLLLSASADAKKCPKDSIQVGRVCVDLYEASVWQTTDAKTIKKIQKGKVTSAADLTAAIQVGALSDDYGPGCPDTGNGCVESYAVSIPGVTPARELTWFQAAAACRNAGKRLLTNQEWQAAAFGTPDGVPCIVTGGAPGATGTGGCVSDVGVFDMVGNVSEWVADWSEMPSGSTTWTAGYGSDVSIFGGNGGIHTPGAMLRGGAHNGNALSGVFATSVEAPTTWAGVFGFRCAR